MSNCFHAVTSPAASASTSSDKEEDSLEDKEEDSPLAEDLKDNIAEDGRISPTEDKSPLSEDKEKDNPDGNKDAKDNTQRKPRKRTEYSEDDCPCPPKKYTRQNTALPDWSKYINSDNPLGL